MVILKGAVARTVVARPAGFRVVKRHFRARACMGLDSRAIAKRVSTPRAAAPRRQAAARPRKAAREAASGPDEDAARDSAQVLDANVGHPGRMWKALNNRIEVKRLKKFADVRDDWIKLMWTLDAYKAQGVPPIGMGDPADGYKARLDGVYRSKGNWFATLVAQLLANRTGQKVAARTKVQGFSQLHQIDVAWPDREVDPLVCVETKVTGGPAYGKTPARGAMSDFSNRRKELKFSATDLKLWHRQQDTAIKHWGEWRADAKPRTYFLWAARLKTGTGRSGEDVQRLIKETDALVRTYLDGAGIFAWRTNEANDAYEVVDLPAADTVSALDDVLYRIETAIGKMVGPTGQAPAAQLPTKTAVDVTALTPDSDKGE